MDQFGFKMTAGNGIVFEDEYNYDGQTSLKINVAIVSECEGIEIVQYANQIGIDCTQLESRISFLEERIKELKDLEKKIFVHNIGELQTLAEETTQERD